jgi:hypothetical protein
MRFDIRIVNADAMHPSQELCQLANIVKSSVKISTIVQDAIKAVFGHGKKPLNILDIAVKYD